MLNPYASRTSTSRPRSSVPKGVRAMADCGGVPGQVEQRFVRAVRIERHQHPVARALVRELSSSARGSPVRRMRPDAELRRAVIGAQIGK